PERRLENRQRQRNQNQSVHLSLSVMDSVIRAIIVYFFLLLIFRVSGKRTLKDLTVFDFVLLLIIAETTQQALLGDDFSITNSIILITTLVLIDIGLSLMKEYSKKFEKLVEGVPMIIL